MDSNRHTERGISVPLVIAGMLAVACVGIWFYVAGQPRQQAQPPGISAEGKAYVRNLKLSEVEMKATESFAGATIVEILGKITNGGDQTLQRVELTCVFYDTAGQVVLRERVPIVKQPAKPGETKNFRLPFEGIPTSWNQTMPQLVIANVEFVR